MSSEFFIAGQNVRDELKQWLAGIVDLYLEKREQYGDSFTTSAEEFKAPSDDNRKAALRLFLQREFDKLKRIHSTIGKRGEKGEEVIADALKDIVGYVCVIRSYLQANPQ